MPGLSNFVEILSGPYVQYFEKKYFGILFDYFVGCKLANNLSIFNLNLSILMLGFCARALIEMSGHHWLCQAIK